MKLTEIHELMRACRYHPEVSGNVATLFTEICDAHQLKKGCLLKDKTMAERLNYTTRAIRKWLAQLVELGFIVKSQREGKRLLIPQHPECSFRNSHSNKEQPFQNGTSVRNSDSAQPGTAVPTQRDNIYPEGRERAPARERAPDEKERSLVKESDSPPVKVFAEVIGRRPQAYEQERINAEVKGAWETAWRSVCQESLDNVGGKPHRVRLGILLKQYQRSLDQQEKQDQRSRRSSSGAPVPTGMFGSGMTDFSELVRQENVRKENAQRAEAAHA